MHKFRTLADGVLGFTEVERFLDLAERLPELTAGEVRLLNVVAPPGSLPVPPKGLL